MCGGGNGGGTPTLFFSNSFKPRNCCGLVPTLLATCNNSGYGCPFGCKGNKGCGSVECETRPRPDGKGKHIANICLLQTQTWKTFKWLSKELNAYYFEPTRGPYR
jgi:hypothetical protein